MKTSDMITQLRIMAGGGLCFLHPDTVADRLSELLERVEEAFFCGFAEGMGGTWVEGDPSYAWNKYTKENPND